MSVSQEDYIKILTRALPCIEQCASFIKEHFGSVGTEQADAKSLNSLVSFVDVEAEKILVKGLKEILPEASFITEEKTTLQSQLTGLQWIIDPLDGTTNFLRGIPAYSTSVALVLDGQPIIGIVIDIHQGNVYTATKGGGAFKNDERLTVTNTKTFDKAMIATGFPYETYSPDHPMFSMLIEVIREARGLRRLGSAAIDLVYTACGVFDAYYEARLNAWDIAAGMLIVQEAGGTISSFDREKNPLLSGSIVAGNAYIYSELTRRLEKHNAHKPS